MKEKKTEESRGSLLTVSLIFSIGTNRLFILTMNATKIPRRKPAIPSMRVNQLSVDQVSCNRLIFNSAKPIATDHTRAKSLPGEKISLPCRRKDTTSKNEQKKNTTALMLTSAPFSLLPRRSQLYVPLHCNHESITVQMRLLRQHGREYNAENIEWKSQ